MPYSLIIFLVCVFFIIISVSSILVYTFKKSFFVVQILTLFYPMYFQICFNFATHANNHYNILLWTLFLIIPEILVIIKLKYFNFYYNNDFIKGFNHFGPNYLINTHIYMICLTFFLYIGQREVFSIVLLIALIFGLNLIKTMGFYKKIGFEDARIEFTAFLGQLYSYSSILLASFRIIFGNSIGLLIIQWGLIFLYIFSVFFKHMALCQLFQNKYIKILFNQNKNYQNNTISSNQKLKIQLKLVLNLLFDQDSFEAKHFSYRVKFQILTVNLTDTDIKRQHNVKQIVSFIDQYKCSQRDYLQTESRNSAIKNKIWKIVLKMCSNNKIIQKNYIFLCSCLPSLTNIQKNHLFYVFYSLKTQKIENTLNKLNRKICFNFIHQKLSQPSKYNSLKPLISLQIPQECLKKQNSFQTEKYKDFFKTQSLIKKIYEKIQQYLSTEELYLNINSNVQQNKLSIFQYFYKKYNIKEQIFKYIAQLPNKNLIQKIKIDFLLLYILENRKCTALLFLNNSLQLLLKNKFKQNFSTTSKKKDDLHLVNDSLTIVCSGIHSKGLILNTCSLFKSIFKINLNSNQNKKNQNSLYIENLMLCIFKDKHRSAMNSNNLYEKPILHQTQNLFMQSCENEKIFEVRFEMFFYLDSMEDFKIILNLRKRQIQKLIIFDKQNNQIFSNYNSQTAIQSQHSLQQPENVYNQYRINKILNKKVSKENTLLFEEQYKIVKQLKHVQKQQMSQNSQLNATSDFQNGNVLLLKQIRKQIKYEKYVQKKSFMTTKCFLLVLVLIVFQVMIIGIVYMSISLSEEQDKSNFIIFITSLDLQKNFCLMNLKILTNLISLKLYTINRFMFKNSAQDQIFKLDLLINFDEMIIVFEDRNAQIKQTTGANNPLIPVLFQRIKNLYHPFPISFLYRNQQIVCLTIQIIQNYFQGPDLQFADEETIHSQNPYVQKRLNQLIYRASLEYKDFFQSGGILQKIKSIQQAQLVKTQLCLYMSTIHINLSIGLALLVLGILFYFFQKTMFQYVLVILRLQKRHIQAKIRQNNKFQKLTKDIQQKSHTQEQLSCNFMEQIKQNQQESSKYDNKSRLNIDKRSKISNFQDRSQVKLGHCQVYFKYYVCYIVFFLIYTLVWQAKKATYQKNIETQRTYSKSLGIITQFVGLTLRNSNLVLQLFDSRSYLNNEQFVSLIQQQLKQNIQSMLAISKVDHLKILLQQRFEELTFDNICLISQYQQTCSILLKKSKKSYFDLVSDLQMMFTQVSSSLSTQEGQNRFTYLNREIVNIYSEATQFQYASRVILEQTQLIYNFDVSSYLSQQNQVIVDQVNLKMITLIVGFFQLIILILILNYLIKRMGISIKQALLMNRLQKKNKMRENKYEQNPFQRWTNQSQQQDLSLKQMAYLFEHS